jgi:hypothetical protein
MPAIGGFLSRLAYTTGYAVSYGVVFPTLFVAQTVPKDNTLVHGLIDGAHAARDSVSAREEFVEDAREGSLDADGDPSP